MDRTVKVRRVGKKVVWAVIKLTTATGDNGVVPSSVSFSETYNTWVFGTS